VGNSGIPIVGVNTGRLGFLADFLPGDIDEAFDEIYKGTCIVEEHAVIGIEEVERGERKEERRKGYPYALNDIAVLKRDNASMISIHTHVNGEYLATYQADGLIVSTPTGSTAYSLSNGGPIIVPQTGTLCLTAVAPHSLNIRPIVIGDDSRVELTVESRSHQFLIAIDGRSEKCDEQTRLIVRRAPYSIHIVKRTGQGYFATLREKMGWGNDTR
jgi:NAD+ kinase